MSEDCQKCGTAIYELDEDRNCPGCSDRSVPPAGDVEVQRFEAVEHYQDQFGDKERHVKCVTAEDFDTIVTRLTAERDALKASAKMWQESADELHLKLVHKQIELEGVQSELTKARELLLHMQNYSNKYPTSPISEYKNQIAEVLGNQSAPAAKGDWCPDCSFGKIKQHEQGQWRCGSCDFTAPENDGGLDE